MDRFVVRGAAAKALTNKAREAPPAAEAGDSNKPIIIDVEDPPSKKRPATEETCSPSTVSESETKHATVSSVQTAKEDPEHSFVSPTKKQKTETHPGPVSAQNGDSLKSPESQNPSVVSTTTCPEKGAAMKSPSSTTNPTPTKPKNASGKAKSKEKSANTALQSSSAKTQAASIAKPKKKKAKKEFVPSEAAKLAAEELKSLSREKLSNMTYDQLKGYCSDLGIPRGGYKPQLTGRLKNEVLIETMLATGGGKKRTTEGTKKFIKETFGANPNKCSQCFLAAVCKGFVDLDVESPSEVVVARTISLCCSKEITVRVKDILYQIDKPGSDYEDGGRSASVFCPECKAGVYITHMCDGQFEPDCGKFHNHCKKCKGQTNGFGECRAPRGRRGCVIQ
eukprot:gb/GECG01011994.1/.p1 GENE.gb/GECG01011994.1/~~gb/GECG01011994.1/.p1  ORF type:complete len:394 (+),score=53.23 gb/GECG01011994.1/:1-1182(+)